jgi:hypothetical protein
MMLIRSLWKALARGLARAAFDRIRPRIPAVADAPDFAETSVLSGRVVGGGADAWRGGRR